MNTLKEWGLLFLFVCAGSLVYCFLIPSGNISKTVRSVVSVIVLMSVCIPVAGLFDTDIRDWDFIEKAETVPDMGEVFAEEIKASVNELIADEIKKYTTVSYKTEIIIDKNEDGSINIGYIGIIFSCEPQRKNELREALFSVLGLMPDIRVDGSL